MTAELAALRRVLARTTWRFRLQRGLKFAVWALAALSGASIVLAASARGALPLAHTALGVGLASALGLLWPSPPARAAHAVDHAAGLVGRCAAALAFLRVAEPERTPFMRAALRDAALHAQRASVAQAAPWHLPRASWLALLLVVIASSLPKPTAIEATPAQTPEKAASTELLLAHDDLRAFRDALERLARHTGDSGVDEIHARYRSLLAALTAGTIDRTAATNKLLELEASLADVTTGVAQRTLLSTLAEELSKVRPALAESSSGGAPRRAAEALAKLGRALAKDEVSERERTRLAAALARARERSAQERSAQQEPRLLAQKEAPQPFEPPERRLLDQKRRELETLRRERAAAAREQQRQLERLTRELAQAEQALNGGRAGSGHASEALERAAEMLSESAALAELKQQLAQLREQLAQQQQQQQQQQQHGDGRESAPQSRSQQSDASEGAESLAERREHFRLRAQGEEAQDAGIRLALGKGAQAHAADGGSSDEAASQPANRTLALGGGSGDGAEVALPGAHARLETTSPTATGEHDERRMAASEQRQRDYEDDVLTNVGGKGPSRSQVIATAARGGFARASYRKVFADYQAHAEELLERDDVPPGYRFYVRRYFQLVRPRTAEETR